MKKFEKKIDYIFKDKELLQMALTHKSLVKENKIEKNKCNERLEFLGDAFLDAIIGEALFTRLPMEREGNLSKKRAEIVCEKSLAIVGRNVGIGRLIMLSKGESQAGGGDKDSIVSDAVEAVIGAIYMDSDYETVRSKVLPLFNPLIDKSIEGKLSSDFKTKFQELIQKKGNSNIEYKTVKSEGPDHAKTFYVEVYSNGSECGKGIGKTKKDAEQMAAKEALNRSK